MRVLLRIEFDGTDYCGWQVQPGLPTVQQELETALGKLCDRPCTVHGAGRTDSGVHSLSMPAHIDLYPHEFKRVAGGLNRYLPPSVFCKSVVQVSDDFNARFDATSRSYTYRIGKTQKPLRRLYEHQLANQSLQLNAMKLAAELSLGSNCWKGFSKEGGGNSTWDINVTSTDVVEDDLGWSFNITANRFLRGVVRIWSGTLLRIGTGKVLPETVTGILKTGRREHAGPSLPACGLTLTEVVYPHGV